MLSFWPPSFQHPQNFHSPQNFQTSQPLQFYTVTASLEVNGREFHNHNQLESRLLGTWVAPTEYVTQMLVPSYAMSAPCQPQQYPEIRPAQIYTSNPPSIAHHHSKYEIRRKTPKEEQLASQISQIHKSNIKTGSMNSKAPLICEPDPAILNINRAPVIRAPSMSSPTDVRTQELRNQRAAQEITEHLRELRESLDREERDHAAAMDQLRGAFLLPACPHLRRIMVVVTHG